MHECICTFQEINSMDVAKHTSSKMDQPAQILDFGWILGVELEKLDHYMPDSCATAFTITSQELKQLRQQRKNRIMSKLGVLCLT